MKKIGLLLGGLAVALTLSTACSKAPSRDDVVAQLKKQMASSNIPDATINCMADGMIAKFGADKLGSNDTLTAEEQAAATKIGQDCALSTMVSTTVAP